MSDYRHYSQFGFARNEDSGRGRMDRYSSNDPNGNRRRQLYISSKERVHQSIEAVVSLLLNKEPGSAEYLHLSQQLDSLQSELNEITGRISNMSGPSRPSDVFGKRSIFGPRPVVYPEANESSEQQPRRESPVERETSHHDSLATVANRHDRQSPPLIQPHEELQHQERPPSSERDPIRKEPISREERQRFIQELSEENEIPAPPMSRSCGICLVVSPHRRAVFTACGHTVCRCCAEKLADRASEARKNIICPFCRKVTDFIPLFETPIGNTEIP